MTSKFLIFSFVILLIAASISGQVWKSDITNLNKLSLNENGQQKELDDKSSSEKQSKKAIYFLSAGINFSSYLQEEGDWQPGYSIGLTFNFEVSKKISITLPFSYARINAAPQNVEGKSYSNDGYIYKTFVDREISVGFIEFPILVSYKLFSKTKYDLSYLLGPGLIIAVKDLSKSVQPEDVTITDEIIDTHDFPLDPVDTRFTIPNSGLNLSTGIRFHLSRFYIDLLYVLYPYEIKAINKLNSISLKLGIDI